MQLGLDCHQLLLVLSKGTGYAGSGGISAHEALHAVNHPVKHVAGPGGHIGPLDAELALYLNELAHLLFEVAVFFGVLATLCTEGHHFICQLPHLRGEARRSLSCYGLVTVFKSLQGGFFKVNLRLNLAERCRHLGVARLVHGGERVPVLELQLGKVLLRQLDALLQVVHRTVKVIPGALVSTIQRRDAGAHLLRG